MVEPSAKILRRTLDENLDGETDNIDRLSALPESILLYIISFLELKEAAATSILSTTWRDLFLQFRSIVLTFNQRGVSSSEHHRLFDIFVGFVNRMLRERNPEIPIKVIRVTVKNFTERMKLGYESLLMSTAFAMSTCKVETIDYSFDMCFERNEPPSIVLPSEMFISETLTGLRLILPKGWVLPENVWLPKLRYAHLIPFRLVDENSIQRFLDGCPRLENVMFIMKEETTKVKNVHMSSSSLKFVMLDWHVIEETNMSITVKAENLLRLFLSLRGGHRVNLDAPNLKLFSIEGQALELNMIQSVPSMEQATIATDCMFHFSDWNDFYSRSAKTCAFFGEFQNLRSLNISEPIMKALYVSKPVMPTFRNLYKIRLIPRYCKDDFTRYWIAHVLFNLFEKCPNLQVLSFKKVFHNYFGEVDFESVFPVSMVQNLKKLEICDFRGLEMEYKLVEYFMNNGQSLVIVSLKKNYSTPYSYVWKQNQRDRILSFLTHGDQCAIVFK